MVAIQNNRLYSSRGIYADIGDMVRLVRNDSDKRPNNDSSLYVSVHGTLANDVIIRQLNEDGTMLCDYGSSGHLCVFVSALKDFIVISSASDRKKVERLLKVDGKKVL